MRTKLDKENLLMNALRAKPEATPDDIRRLLPAFRDMSDEELTRRMTTAASKLKTKKP